MRRLLSILLLFAFITVNFSKVFIWVHYEINKTEITEKYCVNKDKPGMHCCGKCLLKKKLAEDEEKQKSPAMPDVKNDIQLFCSESLVILYSPEHNKVELISTNLSLHSIVEDKGIFHPPTCC